MISEITSFILVMYVTKIIFLSSPGIITIGTGMLDTIFGIEIVMIKNNFSFH